MITLLALGWAELGSVASLAVLWIALASLCVTIVRGAMTGRDRDLPRDL
jgi:hypothetical protein